MDTALVLALGLGVSPPWRLVNQRLDTSKQPHILEMFFETDRGALFPCPECGKSCKAHDSKEFTWRHLNFFQHHCLITAKIPRTSCDEHGVKRVNVPWAREGSGFTLLFEQAAMALVREMPAASRTPRCRAFHPKFILLGSRAQYPAISFMGFLIFKKVSLSSLATTIMQMILAILWLRSRSNSMSDFGHVWKAPFWQA